METIFILFYFFWKQFLKQIILESWETHQINYLEGKGPLIFVYSYTDYN